ncbi:MAG: hypothetical protein ACKO28_00060 [Cyanobium sp.]
MDIDFYKPRSLPEKLAQQGLLYIVKRFKDEWSIDRSEDITVDAILDRTNLVAFEGGKIVGWLGVSLEGEMVNGCAGPARSGSILRALIKRLFAENPRSNYYAFVPVEYLACAYLCVQAGMELSSNNNPELLRKTYGENIISLIKLVSSPFPSTDPVIRRRICRDRINNLHDAINSKVSAGPWLRLTRRLKKSTQDFGSDQASLFMQVMLSLGASFGYYLAFLSIFGHNIPNYFDFLSKKKSVTDRQELRQYLEVSAVALNNIKKQIETNDVVINDFFKVAATPNNTNSFLSTMQDSVSHKQKESIRFMSEILDGYRADIETGREFGGRATAKYIAVLQFMSEEDPYPKLASLLPRNSHPCLKDYVDNLNKQTNIANSPTNCPKMALEGYISNNQRHSPWGAVWEAFSQ